MDNLFHKSEWQKRYWQIYT